MQPSAALKAKKDTVLALARAHGATHVRVFGSVVHGTDQEGSDLDLLVDVEPSVTLFTLSRLEIKLTEILGVPVDVRTPQDLSRHIRAAVVAEAKPL